MQPLDDAPDWAIRKMRSEERTADQVAEIRADGDGTSEVGWIAPSAPAGSGIYKIRVKGHLNSQWSDYLEGMQAKLLDSGEMILCGVIADQAALMGVLNKLYRLNLPLISVNKINQKEFDKMENGTEKDLEMAQVCLNCTCCKIARQEQKGLVYSCVKGFAEDVCPFCQAYERVYGRKAHEPIPAQ
jgi:hypothetical protein